MVDCDIIIPIWNQLELTQKCLTHISQHTRGKISYRLILIDNGSDSPTQNYLQSLKESPDIIYFRFETNQGFPKAINKGLSLSTAPYVCLLNNDVTVTQNWLDHLCDIAERNSHLGAVRASEIKTLDQIPHEDIHEFAQKRYEEYKGQFIESSTLHAACVLLKREAILKTGFLDESFGLGYWEDMDYGIRLLKSGFSIARSQDTFVFHPSQSSFKLIPKLNTLFEINHTKFLQKWGNPLSVCHIIENENTQEGQIKQALLKSVRLNHGYTYVDCYSNKVFSKNLENLHGNIRIKIMKKHFFKTNLFFKILFRQKNKQFNHIYADTASTRWLMKMVAYGRKMGRIGIRERK